MYEYYKRDINGSRDLPVDWVFVFGSNTAGRHGKGAALLAKKAFGAKSGIGFGLMGRCFAIPTKDSAIRTLPLAIVEAYIEDFKVMSKFYSDRTFYVTKIGCGLAGYKDSDIAPLFRGSPVNCIFHLDWKEYLE